MKIVIEIKANEESCSKCGFCMTSTSGVKCYVFHEYLECFAQGRYYKRLDKCKEAEVIAVDMKR